MRRRDSYTNYSKKSKEIETEEPKIDVPVEEAGQAEEPKTRRTRKVEPVVEKPRDKEGIVVNCSSVNVREKADPNAKILGTVLAKGKVIVLGEEGDYYKVHAVKVGHGFIKKDFLEVR